MNPTIDCQFDETINPSLLRSETNAFAYFYPDGIAHHPILNVIQKLFSCTNIRHC
jgi:hypothetical protein